MEVSGGIGGDPYVGAHEAVGRGGGWMDGVKTAEEVSFLLGRGGGRDVQWWRLMGGRGE